MYYWPSVLKYAKIYAGVEPDRTSNLIESLEQRIAKLEQRIFGMENKIISSQAASTSQQEQIEKLRETAKINSMMLEETFRRVAEVFSPTIPHQKESVPEPDPDTPF